MFCKLFLALQHGATENWITYSSILLCLQLPSDLVQSVLYLTFERTNQLLPLFPAHFVFTVCASYMLSSQPCFLSSHIFFELPLSLSVCQKVIAQPTIQLSNYPYGHCHQHCVLLCQQHVCLSVCTLLADLPVCLSARDNSRTMMIHS